MGEVGAGNDANFCRDVQHRRDGYLFGPRTIPVRIGYTGVPTANLFPNPFSLLTCCGWVMCLARMFHTDFLRIGGTGYQPVLVGNLPPGLDVHLVETKSGNSRSLTSRFRRAAQRDGQVARATQRL